MSMACGVLYESRSTEFVREYCAKCSGYVKWRKVVALYVCQNVGNAVVSCVTGCIWL
jgi:hypothetical protein